ncbi:MAG TPA: DUF6526 family protein [Hanamia sp.]|nr:DUF6526 family protein [Hanamia sp.]
MSTQNFKNHTRIVPLYHYVLYLILLICLILSVWDLIRAIDHHSGRITAVVITILTIALIITMSLTRRFALMAQDRAIRAEENLRYFVLNGKLLDSHLTIRQIIALRFAADTEFSLLADRAAKENMSSAEIKKAIINWKPDEYRV